MGLIRLAVPLANYRMDIRYDGRNHFGWQRLKERPTIQGALENAVTQCFGVRCNVEGAGRTDRGAHAEGQVASVRLPSSLDPESAVVEMNEALDPGIQVTALQQIADGFHARHSAIGKLYRYKIWNG